MSHLETIRWPTCGMAHARAEVQQRASELSLLGYWVMHPGWMRTQSTRLGGQVYDLSPYAKHAGAYDTGGDLDWDSSFGVYKQNSGTNYLSVPSDAHFEFDSGDSFTLAAMVRPVSFSGHSALIYRYGTNNDGYRITGTITTGVSRMTVWGSSTVTASGPTMTANNTYTMVGVYDKSGQAVRVYLDLVPGSDAALNNTSNNLGLGRALCFGADWWGAQDWDGYLMNTLLCRRAWSEVEVEAYHRDPFHLCRAREPVVRWFLSAAPAVTAGWFFRNRIVNQRMGVR